jgi:outer membrane protein assembly factor BamA
MRFISLIILIFPTLFVLGQKVYSVELYNSSFQHSKPILNNAKDSISSLRLIRAYQNERIEKGYLLCSVDSIIWNKNKVSDHISDRQKFNGIYLNKDEKRNPIRLTRLQFSQLLKEELDKALNSGYPFASIGLKDIQINESELRAQLYLQKGKFYSWKELHIKGDSTVSMALIQSITQIKPGDPYSEKHLQNISDKITSIPFLEEIKPFDILFNDDGVEIFLYLKSIPVSSANGLVGLQSLPNGRYFLTGDLQLKLTNTLKRGETMQLKWRSIQPSSPSLFVAFKYPYLFKTPFGIDLNFNLFKRDSSFLETKSSIGIQYSLSNGNILKAFYRNHNSDRLNSTTTSISLADLKMSSYGVGFERIQLDYLPNPTKGYEIDFSFFSGSRRSRINDTLPFERSSNYGGNIKVNYYLTLTKRNVLRFSGQSESYYSPQIFTNELSRIGGLSVLRGFNEQEIYASTFTVLTLEYRFLLDRNSNLFVFYDQGFYERNSGSYLKDYPYGFGTGISFGTKIGSFTISYALGKQLSNPILLKDGKIHFGYIAYF